MPLDLVFKDMRRKNVVYLLESEKYPAQRYVGVTSNLWSRLPTANGSEAAPVSHLWEWVALIHSNVRR